MSEKKNILVTGGAGFIGSAICESLLSQNINVICLDNFITGKMENITPFFDYSNFKLIEGDIRNIDDCYKAVNDVDVIIHQAALGSIPRSLNDPMTTNAINIGGFVNILWAAKTVGIKRIVYASSSSVYGDSISLPKVEEVIGSPLSPYALTKIANEQYAEVFSKNYGLELIGLRYFNVYGRRQDPNSTYAAVIPKFVDSLLKNNSPIINGDGTYSRDFTYIDDVVKVNELAAHTQNSEALNQVFNVAAEAQNSINRLFELIRKYLAVYDKKIENIQPIYGPYRKGDIPHSLASTQKAKKLLNYQADFSLEEGLKKTIEWYLNNLKQ